jgi:hypothetical protein
MAIHTYGKPAFDQVVPFIHYIPISFLKQLFFSQYLFTEEETEPQRNQGTFFKADMM